MEQRIGVAMPVMQSRKAPRVGAAHEALWYGLYGISLWVVVAITAKTYGRRLTRQTA